MQLSKVVFPAPEPIPQMTPTLFTGIKSSIGLNLKLVIAAEVLAQTAESMGLYSPLCTSRFLRRYSNRNLEIFFYRRN